MKPIDYILLGGLALAIAGVIAYLIKRKKSGKSGCCGCGCTSCPSAGGCGLKRANEEKNDDETV